MWAPPKEGRDSPVARGGCTALRYDAMLCYEMHCAESSKATRTKQKPKRAVRLSEELVGPGDDWTACAMVEVGMVEREAFSVPWCDWAGSWLAGGWQPMAGASEI